MVINWVVQQLEDCKHSDRISMDLNTNLHADTLHHRDAMDFERLQAHVMKGPHKSNV